MRKLIIEQEHPIGCPECNKLFTFTIKITETDLEKELWVYMNCKHCKTPLTVDLEPYLKADMVIYRGRNNARSNNLIFDFPKEIPAKRHTRPKKQTKLQ